MKITIACCVLFYSLTLSAQSIIKDNRTGCQVVTENPSPLLTATWDGLCENNWANGPGTLIWNYDGKEVARYTGALHQGLPHGTGKYTWNNGYEQAGNYFEGHFLNLDSIYLPRLEKVVVADADKANLYINDGNSQTLFYYALKPKGEVKGTVILLAGSTEPASDVFNHARALIEKANDSGLIVIVPSINNNLWLGTDELNFLNAVIEKALQRYKFSKSKIVMGGFSLGGYYAIRYAEMSRDSHYRTAIRPVAVFAADPPLDMAWLHSVFQHEINRNASATAVAESKRYLSAMETTLGINPAGGKYKSVSAYFHSDQMGGHAKYLRTAPVRIYCDADVKWQMEKRNITYEYMGARDQTAMINLLNSLGNHHAEFIDALGKGYNGDGTRNPHSWSIVDSTGCVEWMHRWLK